MTTEMLERHKGESSTRPGHILQHRLWKTWLSVSTIGFSNVVQGILSERIRNHLVPETIEIESENSDRTFYHITWENFTLNNIGAETQTLTEL